MDNGGDILQLCRLCLVKDDVNIPIFEEQGDIRQILQKISSCLPVKVSGEDKLPKKICDGCSYKLDMFYEFWNTTANSEKQLLKWLGEAEMNSKATDGTAPTVAQPLKPAETVVKQEAIDPSDIHTEENDDDKTYMFQQKFSTEEAASAPAASNEEPPPPKRARRTAAVKAQIAMDPESDDDEDSGEAITKIEDESEDSEGDDHEPSFVDVPSTSADDQPGPSGVGKDGGDAPNFFFTNINMAGVISITDDHQYSTNSSPSSKKTNFVGISPLKELTNVKTPVDRPFRVSIEGNIGAGKSTLIQYFQNVPGIETYSEPIEWWRNLHGHNLLNLLYSDLHQWMKVFQSYVQFTRLSLQTSKPKGSATTVQMFERSLQNNRFCFLELAYRNGYLHEADYAVMDQWYRWIRANVDINLDLIVYLRSSPEVAYERVKTRGRPEEHTITLQYLTQLHESHERWLMTDDDRFNTIPVLVLDADRTLEEIVEEYKQNESKILGYDEKQRQRVDDSDMDKVKRIVKL